MTVPRTLRTASQGPSIGVSVKAPSRVKHLSNRPLVPDELTTSEPDSVALYLREFDRLRSAAVSATKPAPCSIA
jgi:hypothetical protein